MKPPPFLLGAALLFWGWQSGFLYVAALLALILESAQLIKARWEFNEEDFSRVWTFCAVLFLASAAYAFTANDGPSTFGDFFQNPNFRTQGGAGLSTARAGAALFRWLPMIFFLFIAMQIFSVRQTVPLGAISLMVRRRRKKAKLAGRPAPPARDVDIGYSYFAATLLAAGIHPGENSSFFWGVALLITWALWSQRSRRFAFPVWLAALGVAIALGYTGQRGVGQLQAFLEQNYPRWFSRFMRRGFGFDPLKSQTSLGNIGELKSSDTIGIWLETPKGGPVPQYLREASYRAYKTSMWAAGSGTNRSDFQGVIEDFPDSRAWTLLRGKTNLSRVNITCYLNGTKRDTGVPVGLLPLPHGSSRLENLPAYVLSYNSAGAVLAEAPRLVIFDALYGSGATLDTEPKDDDLAVPDEEKPTLTNLVRELKLTKDWESTKRTVGDFFAANFKYSTWQGLTRAKLGETHVSRFLTQTRSGHCEYFATSTVLLLRQAGIPARYAVGYSVHEGHDTSWVVRAGDAHAWCLVWNDATKLWEDFDTTPASWVEAEKRSSPFRWLKDLMTRLGLEFSKFRYGQTKVRQYIVWAMIPVLLLLLYQVIFRRNRRRSKPPKPKDLDIFNWPGLDSEFYLLEQRLAERGLARHGSEPLNEWLRRVATAPGLSDLRGPLEEILRLHYRYRFDPLGLDAEDRATLKAQVTACLDQLRQSELVAAK